MLVFLWTRTPQPMFCCKIVFWHFLAIMQVQNGEIIILNRPKLTRWLIFMSSLGRHPGWQSIIIRTPPNSFLKMSKTGKNLKNPLSIRYNLKIRYIKSQNWFSIDWVYCGQYATFRTNNACLLPVLHAVKVALPVFYQQPLTFTGNFLYNPLYEGPDRPGNILS